MPVGASVSQELPVGASVSGKLPVGASVSKGLPVGASVIEKLPVGTSVSEEFPFGTCPGEMVSERIAAGRKLSKTDEERMRKVEGVIKDLYGSSAERRTILGSLVEDAFRTTDLIFGKKDAVAAGRNFKWPAGIGQRDIARAAGCNFSLAEMALERQAESAHDRLSMERIDRIVSVDDPDRTKLMELVTGMKLLVSEDFVPNNTPPPMRMLYKEVAGSVNKGLLKLWESDLVFIFDKSEMSKFAEPIHYTPLHWTTKVGKEGGRVLFDSKDCSSGPALNSDRAREMLKELYGEISHPLIDDFAEMILDFAAECIKKYGTEFAWDDLILWKGDLKGAFTLLSFSPEGVQYLACELTDDLVMVYHTGLFGWTGTPYAFDVITRVLRREIGKRIRGRMHMYVDDLFGITLKRFLDEDMTAARSVCEGLLGSQAMAEDKWEVGLRLDIIGWSVDLELSRVSIARRNFLKIVYGFFAVDEHKEVQVCTIETLASWSARYKAVLRHAKPLTSALYAEINGMNNREAYKKLSSLGCQAILLWRVLLCMLHFEPNEFARSIQSFKIEFPSCSVEYDASLEGIGVGVGNILDGDEKRTMFCIGGTTFPFDLNHESRHQNTAEFIAVVVGLACLARTGVRGVTVKLYGDSMTSLKWGSKETFKGTNCIAASSVFILLNIKFGFRVSQSEFVRGVDNGFYDKISRGIPPAALGVPPEIIANLQEDVPIQQLLSLCNPTIDFSHPASLVKLWRETLEWIDCFCN